MRVLVLGGTRFVGRCLVEEAVRRGDEVTTLNRGVTDPAADGGVRRIHADRRDSRAVGDALGDGDWDAVVDTWSGAPVVVRDTARLLQGRVGHYGYVSSRSVYRFPIPSGADEGAAVVDADPAGTRDDDYAVAKRGAELAVLAAFPDALLARAGLILGPYEDVGRLPWWLARVGRGDRVPAPGPPDRKLQYVDARDLATWMLGAAERGVAGPFNVVSRPGHTTMQGLLDACNDAVGNHAQLVWLPPETVQAAGVTGWVDLPIWAPPTGELASLHDCDVEAAHAEGLTCRPVQETVEDTWRWLQVAGQPEPRSDRPPLGLSAKVEAALTAVLRASAD